MNEPGFTSECVSMSKDRFFQEMFQHFSGIPPDPDVMMEGYLYKRSSNAFKTWNRRWFQIKDNKLVRCTLHF